MAIFLQIPGVKGESTDKQHQQWIELTDLSFGVSTSVAADVAGKPDFGLVLASKAVDSTSFVLYDMVLNAKPIGGTVIEVTVANAQGVETVIYQIKLAKGFISAISSHMQTTGTPTAETVEFTCSQMEWSNNAPAASGETVVYRTGWDSVLNKPIQYTQ